MSESLTMIVTRANGLPEPIEISVEELRRAIVRNPGILVDTLQSILQHGAGAAGLEPGQPGGILPPDTPIYKMIAADQAAKLSPAATKLTKSDLIALGGWGGTRKAPTELGLSVEDVQTIRDVFSNQLVSGGAASGMAGLACCCCPCCSAASIPTLEVAIP